MADTALDRTVRFDRIRYANCWEDPALLIAALRPAGKRVLSIASGGDNSLALLGAGAEVVAVDISPAQLACVALKVAAIRVLDRGALLGFLGVRPAADRVATFERRLRRHLTGPAAAFWAQRPGLLSRGIIHSGKFEAYVQLFRRRVLPLAHGRRRIAALLEARNETERNAFYAQHWDTWRWRLLFRLFFSRPVLGRLGRDPEFFRYVEGSVAARILERTRHALTSLPTQDNPYLEYILTGNYTRTLPPYLEANALERIRANLDRLTLCEGAVEQAEGAFDGFNLSDLFEYLPLPAVSAVYGALLARARPGARFAYWNLLVPREAPEEFSERVTACRAEADLLFAHDRAFFYRRFVLEEVRA